MDEMTTTLTTTLPLALVQLPSGNYGAIVYSITVGDIALIVLLAALVLLVVYRLWKNDTIVVVMDGDDT